MRAKRFVRLASSFIILLSTGWPALASAREDLTQLARSVKDSLIVEGRVFSDDGSPIQGADVHLESAGRKLSWAREKSFLPSFRLIHLETRTDSSGYFSFSDLQRLFRPLEEVSLTALKEGFQRHKGKARVPGYYRLVLNRLVGFHIYGTVRLAGRPVQTTLRIVNENNWYSQTVSSDQDGQYRVTLDEAHFPALTSVWVASADPQYPMVESYVTLDPNRGREFERNISLTQCRGEFSVSGAVRSEGGEGLADASVWLRNTGGLGLHALTDQGGNYRICLERTIDPRYEAVLEASKTGYHTEKRKIVIETAGPEDLIITMKPSDSCPEGYRVEGCLVNWSGEVIGGGDVIVQNLQGAHKRTSAGSDGRYNTCVYGLVESGDPLLIVAKGQGYKPQAQVNRFDSHRVAVSCGDAVNSLWNGEPIPPYHFVLKPSGSRAPCPEGHLSIRGVVLTPSGVPLEGATVTGQNLTGAVPPLTSQTNSSGRYHLCDRESRYQRGERIEIRADSEADPFNPELLFTPVSSMVTIDSLDIRQDMQFRSFHNPETKVLISGTVKDERGDPASDLPVVLHKQVSENPPTYTHYVGLTNEEGIYHIAYDPNLDFLPSNYSGPALSSFLIETQHVSLYQRKYLKRLKVLGRYLPDSQNTPLYYVPHHFAPEEFHPVYDVGQLKIQFATSPRVFIESGLPIFLRLRGETPIDLLENPSASDGRLMGGIVTAVETYRDFPRHLLRMFRSGWEFSVWEPTSWWAGRAGVERRNGMPVGTVALAYSADKGAVYHEMCHVLDYIFFREVALPPGQDLQEFRRDDSLRQYVGVVNHLFTGRTADGPTSRSEAFVSTHARDGRNEDFAESCMHYFYGGDAFRNGIAPAASKEQLANLNIEIVNNNQGVLSIEIDPPPPFGIPGEELERLARIEKLKKYIFMMRSIYNGEQY